MRNYSKWIMAVVLATPLAAYAQTENENENEQAETHETVNMQDLPAPVQKTIRAEAKGKKVESVKKETENGKTVYEVQLMAKGKGQRVEISEAGKVLRRHTTQEEKNAPEHGGAPSKP